MTTNSRSRAVVYVRISSDPTGRAAGVERQEADCRALAEQLGWTVVEVRRDNDVSATTGRPRPGFKALLEDLRSGHADAVIAWHPDRLYRRLPDLEELARIANERGTQIRTVRAGALDLSTASGLMTAEILASVAKHEVAHATERVVRAKADKVARGEWAGGPRPFGFEPDGVTVRESEAHWIRWATDAVIGGASVRSVTAHLNEVGALPAGRRRKREDGTRSEAEPKPWRPSEVRRMLLRGRNSGLAEHKGEVVGKAVWPAVVEEERWRACREVLLNPARRTSPGNTRVWLGSGIYKCGVCGSYLICTTTGRAGKPEEAGPSWVAAYRCKANSGHVIRRAVNLDNHVEGLVIDWLSTDAAAEFFAPVPPKDPRIMLAAEANTLREKLESVARDYVDDLVTRAQMLTMTASARARLDQVEAEMASHASTSVLAALPLGTPEIAKQWPDYPLERRRAIVSAVMEIIVHKARRGRPTGFKPGNKETYFDPTTVEIRWKTPGAE